jgi:hypothetical protein
MYQQATRCRDIKALYFYGESKNNNAKYKTLEDAREEQRDMANINKTILDLCY